MKDGIEMELYEKVETVKSREVLIDFINDLRNDLHVNQDAWENKIF